MSTSISIEELIFNNNNNTFTVEYSKAGFDFSLISKVAFKLQGVEVNSDDNPEFFNFITGPVIVGTGRIIFLLGEAGYAANNKEEDAKITLFGPGAPLGIVFSSTNGPTKVSIVVV